MSQYTPGTDSQPSGDKKKRAAMGRARLTVPWYVILPVVALTLAVGGLYRLSGLGEKLKPLPTATLMPTLLPTATASPTTTATPTAVPTPTATPQPVILAGGRVAVSGSAAD